MNSVSFPRKQIKLSVCLCPWGAQTWAFFSSCLVSLRKLQITGKQEKVQIINCFCGWHQKWTVFWEGRLPFLLLQVDSAGTELTYKTPNWYWLKNGLLMGRNSHMFWSQSVLSVDYITKERVCFADKITIYLCHLNLVKTVFACR